jgi:hypothetical protein
MTSEKNKTQAETAELREEIAALYREDPYSINGERDY